MTKTKSPRVPKYRRLKRATSADAAFVELCGRRIALGRFGTPESRQRYHRLIAEWLANGRRLDNAGSTDTTIVELAAAFWHHAERHYRKPNGTQTSTLHNYQAALRPLKRLYGPLPVTEFGPAQLKVCRQAMMDARWCRGTVNKTVNLLRGVFRWGVAEGLVPVVVHTALCTVRPLERGRTEAQDHPDVEPVSQEHIEAIREHVSRPVWGLIQLQVCTGARPGELLRLRPIDLNTSAEVWTFEPPDHKNSYRGHKRRILIGPHGQEILRAFMVTRPVDGFVFSPRDAAADRAARASSHRRSDQADAPRKTTRRVRDYYDIASYRRAIHRACESANIPKWNPAQLRHNTATMLRERFGIDLAATVLGHRLGSQITEVYAAANIGKAIDAVAKTG